MYKLCQDFGMLYSMTKNDKTVLERRKEIIGILKYFPLNEKKWIQYYILWEIYLIQELGFGIDYDKLKLKKDSNFQDLIIDGTGYEVPLFIFDELGDVSDSDIKKGLVFTRKLLMNKFFLINNIQFPKSRITLENYF